MEMRFKTDENIPSDLVDLLTDAGHDALGVLDQDLGGAEDSQVASACQRKQRILVTLDSDFADIRTYPPSEYSGIIVLRLNRQDTNHICGVFSDVLSHLDEESAHHRLWIVSEEHIRIRA